MTRSVRSMLLTLVLLFAAGPPGTAAADPNCDPEDQVILYPDADGDGYGQDTTGATYCIGEEPPGMVDDNTDCDDLDDDVYPGAAEVCNGVDDDCDASIDEGVTQTWYQDNDHDGYGTSSSTTQACTQPAGYADNASDCNDYAPSIHPGAFEICNEMDDDCDSAVDEGAGPLYYVDSDDDGFGAPGTGGSRAPRSRDT